MILQYLDSLTWSVSFLLVATIFMLFTTIGILFVRRKANLQRIQACQNISGIIFSNLGALYAVLLGFTIVNAQERFDSIKQATQLEAACLIDLYRDSDFFMQKDQENIRKAIIAYVKSIVDNEWSAQQPHVDTGKKFKELLRCYYNVDVESPQKTIWYTASVEQLNKLSDLRLARVMGSQESIRPEMWTILILGGAAMIISLCFLDHQKSTQHLWMASLLAVTIACSLFLIHSLDSAFTGSTSIQADALRNLLHMMVQDLSCT